LPAGTAAPPPPVLDSSTSRISNVINSGICLPASKKDAYGMAVLEQIKASAAMYSIVTQCPACQHRGVIALGKMGNVRGSCHHNVEILTRRGIVI